MSVAESGDDFAGALAGRKMITAALLMAMAVTALEQTVVSTAMPSIIAQLKGLDIYPWVFSAYLLAATVTTPVYGKLADLLGRKRVLLFGLALFTFGSIFSGLFAEHGRIDRHAGRAGARGGCGGADHHHDDRRPVHAPRAGEGPGPFQHGLGRVEPDRAGDRRRPDRPALLALGVLRDRPVRGGLGLATDGHVHEKLDHHQTPPIDWWVRCSSRADRRCCSWPS